MYTYIFFYLKTYMQNIYIYFSYRFFKRKAKKMYTYIFFYLKTYMQNIYILHSR